MWKGVATSRSMVSLWSLLLVAACGFPRPRDVPDDPPSDGPSADTDVVDAPGTIVHVATTGDDSQDGTTHAVRTLARAIVIASSNSMITEISLNEGIYSAATGESFPYTVPLGVMVAGRPAGGSILAGSGGEDGLAISAGSLRDLELTDFKTAIVATARVGMTNVAIKNSLLAIQAEASAELNVDTLGIVGSTEACGAGIKLNGGAELDAIALDTHNLTSAVAATGPSPIRLSKSNIVADPRCHCFALQVFTGREFVLTDSVVVGCEIGLWIGGSGASLTHATITNSTLRNAENAIFAQTGAALQVAGGEFSNNTKTAIGFFGGGANLLNVKVISNLGAGFFVMGQSTSDVATVLMRSCTVTGNKSGVSFFDFSAGDLGTSASPGNNIIQSSQTVGVSVQGTRGPQQVDAVGNIWNPDAQGANSDGVYSSVVTVSGPVPSVAGNNFDIASGLSLRR